MSLAVILGIDCEWEHVEAGRPVGSYLEIQMRDNSSVGCGAAGTLTFIKMS